MNRYLLSLGLLAGSALLVHPGTSRAQQPGTPALLQSPLAPSAAPAPVREEEPNKDIMVPINAGPWMVCVASYTTNAKGDDPHVMARQLVAELRGPTYKLPAYVFNYGAEEKRKERDRVKKLMDEQRSLLQKLGVESPTGIRVRTTRHEEQVAVLVGGYRDIDAAKRALDAMKLMPCPDKDKVKMDSIYIIKTDPKTKQTGGEYAFINPLQHGFVVKNPALPKETVEAPKYDMDVLQRLNAVESFSLLKCPKQYTLAVKLLQNATLVQHREQPPTLWEKLGFGKRALDPSAESAHNLAELLRKGGFEVYVMHTKVASVVTIGSYESADDPRMQRMKEQFAQMSRDPRYSSIGFIPTPHPMLVPR